MKKVYLILIALVLFTGCAEYQTLKSFVANEGAKFEDEKLKVKLWQLCTLPRRGALVRYFGSRPKKAAALVELCSNDLHVDLFITTKVIKNE